jgi:hypothetical protein
MNQNKISNLENTRPTNITRRKPVQPRHPPQASTQINCTGPTLHTAEPHAERKYDPARQRNSQRPSTPKINKTRDECNKCINTHTKHRLQKQRKKKIPPEERPFSKKKNHHNTAIKKENPMLS